MAEATSKKQASKKAKQPPKVGAGELRIALHGEGMSAVHRAGLGGLAMTLEMLNPKQIADAGRWEIKADEVVLSWGEGGPQELLSFIFREGLAVDAKGIIDFAGLRNLQGVAENEGTRLMFQSALRGTFLQHGKSREMLKERIALVLDPDTNQVPDEYQPMVGFVHQNQLDELLTALVKGQSIELVGWFLPGSVEKHPGTAKTRMQASPEQFMALLFAPVGCISFLVSNKLLGNRQSFALIVPEFDNLKTYAKMRRLVGQLRAREVTVASAEEGALLAALQMAPGMEGAEQRLHELRWTVMGFGTQAWASQQKTRTLVRTLHGLTPAALHNYRFACNIMEFQTKRVVSNDKKSTWVATSAARGAIARSIVEGHPWWQALIDSYRQSSDFRKAVHYSNERKGLAIMVQNAQWDEGTEKLFVDACHAAMRTLYGSIGDRTGSAGTNFSAKAATEMTKIRSSFLRAKNADTFRDALMDFWSRASRSKVRSNSVLRKPSEEGGAPVWQQILPLLDERSWRKGRDLALLALISYAGKEQPSDETVEEGQASVQE